MEKKREFLDDLAAQTGCQYLSDLHLQNKRVKVVQAVRHLSADSYSAAQWEEAARYIWGDTPTFADAEQGRQYFLTR